MENAGCLFLSDQVLLAQFAHFARGDVLDDLPFEGVEEIAIAGKLFRSAKADIAVQTNSVLLPVEDMIAYLKSRPGLTASPDATRARNNAPAPDC